MVLLKDSFDCLYENVLVNIDRACKKFGINISDFGVDFVEKSMTERVVSCTDPQRLLEILKSNEKINCIPVIQYFISELER